MKIRHTVDLLRQVGMKKTAAFRDFGKRSNCQIEQSRESTKSLLDDLRTQGAHDNAIGFPPHVPARGLTPTSAIPLPPESEEAAPSKLLLTPMFDQICFNSFHCLHIRYESARSCVSLAASSGRM